MFIIEYFLLIYVYMATGRTQNQNILVSIECTSPFPSNIININKHIVTKTAYYSQNRSPKGPLRLSSHVVLSCPALIRKDDVKRGILSAVA